MKNLSTFVILLLLLISSCGNDFYVASPGNLLILEEKKDLKASIAFNSAQLAYSPANNLGVKADFAYVNHLDEYQGDEQLLLGTIGVGTYFSRPVKALFPNKKKLFANPQLCSIGIEFYANASLGKQKSLVSPLFTRGGLTSFRNTTFGVFKSNVFKPHISSQVYWQSRSITINFGLRTTFIYYYDAFAFGEFSENDLKQARDLITNSPFYLVEYDLQIAKGNSRVQSFIGASWGSNFGPLVNGNGSVTFGLKVNIPNLAYSIKNNKYKKRVKRDTEE